ncbi:MAG: hypothetical protein M1826_002059 [Phylliscum demangeonii]|nr:MAG: hypothetical protein M1826_002059 [Phylliscum demangeonii]
MNSRRSASRRPLPSGPVVVVARSDDRVNKAAWVSRLRLRHPTECVSIGGPVAVGSYFDPETVAVWSRDFLQGILELLGHENGRGKSIDLFALHGHPILTCP